jgi:hypothetical protein
MNKTGLIDFSQIISWLIEDFLSECECKKKIKSINIEENKICVNEHTSLQLEESELKLIKQLYELREISK